MIDTTQFDGPGAVFGLVLAYVTDDYWYAPSHTLAHITAEQFVEGGECQHIECLDCPKGHRCDDLGGYETTAGVLGGMLYCAGGCGHDAERHVVATYDWGEWRDFLIETLGIEAAGFVRALKIGRGRFRG